MNTINVTRFICHSLAFIRIRPKNVKTGYSRVPCIKKIAYFTTAWVDPSEGLLFRTKSSVRSVCASAGSCGACSDSFWSRSVPFSAASSPFASTPLLCTSSDSVLLPPFLCVNRISKNLKVAKKRIPTFLRNRTKHNSLDWNENTAASHFVCKWVIVVTQRAGDVLGFITALFVQPFCAAWRLNRSEKFEFAHFFRTRDAFFIGAVNFSRTFDAMVFTAKWFILSAKFDAAFIVNRARQVECVLARFIHAFNACASFITVATFLRIGKLPSQADE